MLQGRATWEYRFNVTPPRCRWLSISDTTLGRTPCRGRFVVRPAPPPAGFPATGTHWRRVDDENPTPGAAIGSDGSFVWLGSGSLRRHRPWANAIHRATSALQRR
jgi:hypothetical protein